MSGTECINCASATTETDETSRTDIFHNVM